MGLKPPIFSVQNSLKFIISSSSIQSLPIVIKADMVTDLFLNTDSVISLDANTKLTWVITDQEQSSLMLENLQLNKATA